MSHPRGRMPGEFDSRKDSHSTKVEQRPQIFVKLIFRELCGSKLSVYHVSVIKVIRSVKSKKIID